MKQITDDSAWKRTLTLIEEKYGKKLQFRALKLLSDYKKTAYSHGDDFVIPLSLKNHDLGNVIVTRGSFLSDEQKGEIVDLIKFLVEPQVYNLHLKTAEQNMVIQKEPVKVGEENIIKLYDEDDSSTTRCLLSQIIHLKSHTPQTRHKVAMKIHEMTERNLLVRFSDIVNDSTTAMELLDLSDVTVFIEDIESLSSSELKLLEDFLALMSPAHSGSQPILLVGSSLPLEKIEGKPWTQQLRNDLMGFYFDIDRVPLNQQTSDEILDLLFFEVNEPMS